MKKMIHGKPKTQGKFSKYTLSFRLFYIGIILQYADFVRNAIDMQGEIFPYPIRVASLLIGPFFLLSSAAVAFMEGQLKRLKTPYRSWSLFLLFIVVVLMVTGVLIFRNSLRQVILDASLFPAIFAGILAGSKKENWIVFDKLMMSIFSINVLVCLVWIRQLIQVAKVAGRRSDIVMMTIKIQGANLAPYMFYGSLSILCFYFLLTVKERTILHKGLIFLGTGLFYMNAIIYQKRFPFVHLPLFILLVTIKTRIKHWHKIVVVLLAIGILFATVFEMVAGQEKDYYLTKLTHRFYREDNSGILDTLMTEDRLSYDPILVFTQFSGLEFIIGRGLGGTVQDVAGYYPEEMTHALHNGMAVIMLKGGIFFLTIWMTGWLLTMKDFLVNRDSTLNRYYIPLLIIILLSWVGEFISDSQNFTFLMMCAGRVMSRDID